MFDARSVLGYSIRMTITKQITRSTKVNQAARRAGAIAGLNESPIPCGVCRDWLAGYRASMNTLRSYREMVAEDERIEADAVYAADAHLMGL